MVQLYKECNAIIYTVKEGIVVINKAGKITQINEEAKRILHIQQKDSIKLI